ncbi:MAG: hypothetical protein IKY17_04750, partial [Oscillospiraceae bacterium]|nr:hypothetical protein [Oscillospiraceae bacterium]
MTTDNTQVVISYTENGIEKIATQQITVKELPTLKFASANSFTIATGNSAKNWNGTLYYSTDKASWTEWDGTSAIASASNGSGHRLYLRGTGNTVITGNSNNYRWVL